MKVYNNESKNNDNYNNRIIDIHKEYLTENELQFSNKNANVGDIKRWIFKIEIEENKYAKYYINSSVFDIPKIYRETNALYSNKNSEEIVLKEEKLNLLPLEEYEIIKNIYSYCNENIVELKEWGANCLEVGNNLLKEFETSNYKEDQLIKIGNDRDILITLCSYSYGITSINDIDFYLSYENDISSSSTFSSLIENIVNIVELEKRYEDSKNSLYEYYEKNSIFELKNKDYSELGEEDREILSFYSDWHKDIYHVRPYGERDVCEQIYLNKINLTNDSDNIEMDFD